MPEYHLDTDGEVAAPASAKLWPHPLRWNQLSEFAQGYIQAMFWTSEARGVSTEEWQADEDHDEGSIPGDVGFADLAPNALAAILTDCADFERDNAAMLADALERGYGAERAGHDFWLTRNHHGAGFWDREELEPEGEDYERLTAIMVAAGEDRAAWDKACAERETLKEDSLGQRLTKAAEAFGESDCYLGDDGKVYI